MAVTEKINHFRLCSDWILAFQCTSSTFYFVKIWHSEDIRSREYCFVQSECKFKWLVGKMWKKGRVGKKGANTHVSKYTSSMASHGTILEFGSYMTILRSRSRAAGGIDHPSLCPRLFEMPVPRKYFRTCHIRNPLLLTSHLGEFTIPTW